jgi:protein PET117
MYKGVLRDDARRAAKLRERQVQLEESLKKRKEYERVQQVKEEG